MVRNRRKYAAIFLFISLLFGMTLCGCGKETPDTAADEDTTEELTEATETVLPSEEPDIVVDDDGFVVTNDYVKTTGENVNVRVKPSTDADIYMVLGKGVDLNRTGYNDSWTRVKLNGSSFYVYSEYLEETEIDWATSGDAETVTHIVFLDPAAQMTADTETEPIRPGAEEDEEMKARASAGATGVSTGTPEYALTLTLSKQLKQELEERGYTVYLTRETNEASVSNAERAEMANAKGAEIYVRLRAGSGNAELSGVMGFITTPAGRNYDADYQLSRDILDEVSIVTGAEMLGIYETDQMTTINWCEMPVAVISVGFLTNEADDTSLAAEDYQKKLVRAIADGIDLYFEGESEE